MLHLSSYSVRDLSSDRFSTVISSSTTALIVNSSFSSCVPLSTIRVCRWIFFYSNPRLELLRYRISIGIYIYIRLEIFLSINDVKLVVQTFAKKPNRTTRVRLRRTLLVLRGSFLSLSIFPDDNNIRILLFASILNSISMFSKPNTDVCIQYISYKNDNIIIETCNKNGTYSYIYWNWKLLHNNVIPCLGEIRLEECSAANINI